MQKYVFGAEAHRYMREVGVSEFALIQVRSDPISSRPREQMIDQ